jgi:hypothetical protein
MVSGPTAYPLPTTHEESATSAASFADKPGAISTAVTIFSRVKLLSPNMAPAGSSTDTSLIASPAPNSNVPPAAASNAIGCDWFRNANVIPRPVPAGNRVVTERATLRRTSTRLPWPALNVPSSE